MGHLDSHCHLDDERFTPDRTEVAARAAAAGITHVILPGVDASTFGTPLPHAPGLTLYRSAGLHPAFPHAADDLAKLERALQSEPIVAIGECGLDRRHRRSDDLESFLAHLDLAGAHGLPVILHVVHAHEEVLGALRSRPGLQGVAHAFSGPWAVAKRYLDLGIKLGIGGIGTWPTAHRLHETIRKCPRDGFVLETDAPDLSPSWKRGERNEPAELLGIAQAVATLRGMTPEEVLDASDATGAEVFGLAF